MNQPTEQREGPGGGDRDEPDGSRNPFAEAYYWVSQILAIVLTLLAPGLGGIWIDRQIGTSPAVTLVGFAVGGAVAFWRLLTIAKQRRV